MALKLLSGEVETLKIASGDATARAAGDCWAFGAGVLIQHVVYATEDITYGRPNHPAVAGGIYRAPKVADVEAFSLGDELYIVPATGNGVSVATGASFLGIVTKAATAAETSVEFLHCQPVERGISDVSAKTADYTVTKGDSGKTFTTVGASGTVVFALPAALVGMKYRFRVGAAQELRIDPNGTELMALPSTGVPGAAGKYLTANADGETVEIECTKAGQWSVFGYTGTWTAEA